MPDTVTQIRLGDIVPAGTTDAAFADARVAPDPPASDRFNAVVTRTVVVQITRINTQSRQLEGIPAAFNAARLASWIQAMPSDQTIVYIGQEVADRIVWGDSRQNTFFSAYVPNEGSYDYVPYPTDEAVQWIGDVYQRFGSTDPVNQIPYLTLWRDHCGRFAHQLDALYGSRSMTGLSRGRRQVAVDYLDARVGNMWQLLTSWAAIDPKTDNSWEAARPSIQQAIEDLCSDCDSPMFPVTIAKNINTRPFQLALDEGRVPAIDNSVTPWVPGRTLDSVKLTALTTDLERIQAISGFRESLRAGHAAALAHFEAHGEHVAAHDHAPIDE